MKTLAVGAVVLGLAALVVADDNKVDKKVYKVTAEELAKEFKDDPAAAKKKYGGKPAAEIQITGSAGVIIGTGAGSELVIDTPSKVTIRLATAKRPAKFPAKFTATAVYKDYFEMGKELSLTSTKLAYK